MTPFPIPDPITSAWLTTVLGLSRILPNGSVQTVDWQDTGAFNSATTHLVLHYSADAPSGVPTHLILKRNISAAWGIQAGAEEVKFYSLVATLPTHPRIIVPCYAAAYDHASGDSYLLLQNLSATHRPPVTRAQQISIREGVPSSESITACVETLAHLHAYWWEHPLLATDLFPVGYWTRTAERFAQYLQRRTASWARLISQEAAWFPEDIRLLYERVLANLPHHWEHYLAPRFQHKRHLTLVHGDAYFANFLCPQLPASGQTYLLDWQEPGCDIGGYDLANLCATFWTSEQRHEDQREMTMLRHYFATLQAHGVNDYTWEDLLNDYRLGIIYWLLVPVQDGADGSSKDYWWPKMQCLVTAFREWRCEELLA